MGTIIAAVGVAVMLAAALLTALVRRLALSRGVLDIPNQRSSHSLATPRGGGIAIVASVTLALLVLALRGTMRLELACALTAGGLVVALVGFLDDRRSLPAATRLSVHFLAALWALAWLGGLPTLRVGTHLLSLGWFGYLLGAFGIVWVLNLFNFMDGIDGIAASEAIFVALAGALLTSSLADGSGVGVAALVFAAACGGFLLWNWPPARIFLGDVGSSYLGYVIAVLALSANRDSPVALWIWLILGGTFFVDATVTLLRRLLRRERVYQAHRCHAYQWLARGWGSHRKVTLTVLGVNVVWLLPWAMLAARFPSQAGVAVVAALVPLAIVAAALGSGRREDSPGGN